MATNREYLQQGAWRARAEAFSKGYTRKVYIDGGMEGGEFLIKPDEDLDGRFKAYGLDWDSWTWVSGWNCLIEDAED